MTTFYFVRHGAKVPGPGDVGLSQLGHQQAAAVARRLRQPEIAAIYSSPLRRARETAQSIAAAHQSTVLCHVNLRERANWGDVAGQTLSQFIAIWQRCNEDRDYAPPGGISSRQAGARIETLAATIHRKFPDQTVVAVTHGGVLMDFLLNQFTLEELTWRNPLAERDPYSSGVIPECSLTSVRYDGQRFTLEMLGDIIHLADLFRLEELLK